MTKVTSIAGFLTLSVSLSGCGLMEDAFKAGVIFALIIIAIIALVIWLAHMVRKSVLKKYDFTWDEDEVNPGGSGR